MKDRILTRLAIFLFSLPVGLYGAFVAMLFWNWFLVPVLHVSDISYLQMLGILWLIQLVLGRSINLEQSNWTLLWNVIELCVPSDRQTELARIIDEKTDTATILWEGFVLIFTQAASYTEALILGWALHLFMK